MLKGKIIQDGPNYSVKVGSVNVDITDDVRTLIAKHVVREVAEKARAIAEERDRHADVVKRYNKIARIVLAGGAGMPTG